MFAKAPRFNEPLSPDSGSKSPTPIAISRDSTTSSNQDGEDRTPGLSPVRKNPSSENEQVHASKRPLSTDRKAGPPDKKKTPQRELKRTTSYIPRATTVKTKSQTMNEAKKTSRKSEVSLKTKDVYDDISGKGKKMELFKGSKTTLSGILNSRTSRENDCGKSDTETPRVSIGTRTDALMRNLSSTRVGKSYSKSSHSHDVSMMRYSDRSESRSRAAASSPNVDEGSDIKNLEAQFAAKKTVYAITVKEFKDKQRMITDQFRVLQDLQKKILAQTGKELPLEDTIKLTDLKRPFVYSDASKTRANDEKRVITFETKVFDHLAVNITECQSRFDSLISQGREVWSDLLLILSNSRKEMLKKLIDKCSTLDRTWLELEEKRVEEAIQNAKCQSKIKTEELVMEIKKLNLQYETLREELKIITESDKFSSLITKDYRDMSNKLKELDEELKKEKIKNEDLQEKRNMLQETNLAESEKIENLEQQLSTQQRKVIALTSECKNLKQRKWMGHDVSLKGKDLKDLKAKSELLKALENHIAELTNDYKAQKKAFQDRIKELERTLSEKEEELKAETQSRLTLEASLAEAEEKIRNVREKKKAFSDMVDKTKQILQNTNGSPTKREEQMWTELEGSKIIAKGYQDQLKMMKEEKGKLLLKFQAISEDKSNQQTERLAAELLRKEEMIKTLKEQVTELQNACEEHSVKYNKLLAQMKEVHDRMDGKTDAAALSKQLGDVKMQKKELQEAVKELVTHNEELETALVQRSLELDQRDRLVKQQCNLLKMRDELTDLVRNKDEAQYQGVKKVMEQSSRWEKKAEKIYKDLEKKANELDDMYKVLVEKQKQIEKLTRLVKIMEDQQDRAQQQRVRFESKIAELQRQLSEVKQKRLKSPLFK